MTIQRSVSSFSDAWHQPRHQAIIICRGYFHIEKGVSPLRSQTIGFQRLWKHSPQAVRHNLVWRTQKAFTNWFRGYQEISHPVDWSSSGTRPHCGHSRDLPWNCSSSTLGCCTSHRLGLSYSSFESEVIYLWNQSADPTSPGTHAWHEQTDKKLLTTTKNKHQLTWMLKFTRLSSQIHLGEKLKFICLQIAKAALLSNLSSHTVPPL